MKRILILSIIIIIAFLLTGCFQTPAMDTEADIQIKIIGIEQEAFCGGKTIMVKGEQGCQGICNAAQNNNCNCGCNCPDCPTCPDCPDCPDIPECPDCPCPCLSWGDLIVKLQITNEGNEEGSVPEVCVEITYQDGTKETQCAETDFLILGGETKYEQVEYKIPRPAKRVILAELIEEIVK